MPDGDRFERTLRRGWCRAYRLTFSEEGYGALNDTLLTASAAYLRDGFSADCLRKFPRAICQALADEAAKKRSGQAASDPFIFLQGVLHEIRSSES